MLGLWRRVWRRANAALGRRSSGFTILELLMVMTIISIITAAALPAFSRFMHRSRRAEAYQSLSAIRGSQEAFYAEMGGFADTFDELGFEITGADAIDSRTIEAPYYTYTITALEVDGVPRADFRAIATGELLPGSPVLDILLVQSDLTDFD
jgi:prepilin-type N-terminal cleavage/methylation domain-containing protein